MPENKSAAGEQQPVVPAAGEGGGAPAPDNKQNGAPADGGAPASGEGKGEGEGAGDGKPPVEPPKPADGAGGDEPPVRQRKTAKDFIIARKEKKIEKMQAGQAPAAPQSGDGGSDDDPDQKDRDFILETVKPIVEPILEKSLQEEDERELQDFLKDNPNFKPYEAKARTFMQHPSRRQLPIKSIFYEVAGDDLMKIGAERAQKAKDDEARNGAGGGSSRAGDGTPDVWGLSKEEFEQQKEQVRQNH